jgi:hypothetical protein
VTRAAADAGSPASAAATASRILLGATLGARARPASEGGGGDPKAGKEASKILAKAVRGAAVGGVGAEAAVEAATAVMRAAGLE